MGLRIILVGFALSTGCQSLHAPAIDVSGTWVGCWRSDKNGHHGKMKATFCRIDHCRYKGVFHGTFWKVLPFFYTETFTVTSWTESEVRLDAAKVLGPRLGRFEVRVSANQTQLVATFQSQRDWGVFLLQRETRR